MAADAGSVRGMIQYGVSLEEGIGCRKDVVKALDFYKKAIAKGSTIALTKAAKLLLLGDDGVKEDLETAVNYLSKAKDNGDDDAASILEELFEDEEGDEGDDGDDEGEEEEEGGKSTFYEKNCKRFWREF